MKTYELLMFEWNSNVLEKRLLKEDFSDMGGASKGGIVGAGIGAVGGAALQVRQYLQKRKALKQQEMTCQGDPSCMQQVKSELSALRGQAIKSGLGKMIAGGVAGGAAGAAVGTVGQIGVGAMNAVAVGNAGFYPGSPETPILHKVDQDAMKFMDPSRESGRLHTAIQRTGVGDIVNNVEDKARTAIALPRAFYQYGSPQASKETIAALHNKWQARNQ